MSGHPKVVYIQVEMNVDGWVPVVKVVKPLPTKGSEGAYLCLVLH